jgi:hypothetical protein
VSHSVAISTAQFSYVVNIDLQITACCIVYLEF